MSMDENFFHGSDLFSKEDGSSITFILPFHPEPEFSKLWQKIEVRYVIF